MKILAAWMVDLQKLVCAFIIERNAVLLPMLDD